MRYKLINLLLLAINLLYSQLAYAAPSINICLTGKVETFLPNYKTSFLNAANLALINNPSIKNIALKTYFFDGKPLSAIRTYNQMVHDHCSAIIGFEYLSDLLLVAKYQRNTNIPIFTSYASSLDSDVLPDNIFIFMPSYNYQAKKMLNFLHKKYKKIDNVLLITEVDSSSLERYKIAYKELLDKEKIHYDTFDFLGNDSLMESKLKKFITNKSYDFVFVFSSAVGSTKIINIMNNHNIVFIGTEYFGSSTNQSVFVRLNNKKVNAYVIRNLDLLKSTPRLNFFTKDYMMHYSSTPNPLAVYTYDAMSIILNSLKKYHSINVKNILKSNNIGISEASVVDGKFYRSKQYVILSISENGFLYVE